MRRKVPTLPKHLGKQSTFNVRIHFNLYAFGCGVLWPQFIGIVQLDWPELISGQMLKQQ